MSMSRIHFKLSLSSVTAVDCEAACRHDGANSNSRANIKKDSRRWYVVLITIWIFVCQRLVEIYVLYG